MITDKEISIESQKQSIDTFGHKRLSSEILAYKYGFHHGVKWAIEQLTKHKELTLTLDNGEIKPAADGK